MSINAQYQEEERYAASYDQLRAIESLLHTSTLDDQQRAHVEQMMNWMDNVTADEVIWNLRMNQQLSDKQLYKKLAVR